MQLLMSPCKSWWRPCWDFPLQKLWLLLQWVDALRPLLSMLRLSFATTLTELASVMTERLHAYLTHCKTVQNSARNCRNHQLSKNDEQCTSLLRCSYIPLIQEFQAMPNAMNTPTFWKASIPYKKYTANLTPLIQTSLSITQLHNSASKLAFYFINSKV